MSDEENKANLERALVALNNIAKSSEDEFAVNTATLAMEEITHDELPGISQGEVLNATKTMLRTIVAAFGRAVSDNGGKVPLYFGETAAAVLTAKELLK